MLKRRSAIKWLHWTSLVLIVWFYLIEPGDLDRLGAAALDTHAGMGVLLALVTGIWFLLFLTKGMAGRPGPKLPGWARRIYPPVHRALYYGVPVMVMTGALAGFAAPYVIRAFGVVPISPGFGGKTIHGLMQDLHELAFNLLIATIILHTVFHLWRHFLLKDNALRIMVPKALHRYL